MSQTPTLDLLAVVPGVSLDVTNTMAQYVLENSKGETTMSNEDMKIAIVSLLHTCTVQQKMIDELTTRVNAKRTEKPKRRFGFKK